MTTEVFFVRHGHYVSEFMPDGGGLTHRGREQAAGARQELLSMGLGRNAFLLSSNIQRAVETADILHAGPIGERVVASSAIAVASFAPRPSTMSSTLTETAQAAGYNIREADGVVVVAHAPLVAAMKGIEVNEDDIGYGEVVPCTLNFNEFVDCKFPKRALRIFFKKLLGVID